MTTNDETRAALVDKAELADRIAALITLRTQWSPIDRALEIIDTVLSDRAVPEPDELIERIAELADQFACGAAGEPVVYALHGPMDFAEEVIDLVTAAGDDLDALLNTVHPDCYIDAMRIWGDGTHYVQLCGIGKSPYFAIGTGPTRIAAIQNAVDKANR